ncbi:MAG: sodium/proton antiporter NhaB [Marinagarivorans sp.]|nr:sodium/proton antiporter NhaB [Marinagarivorans sp.]
MAQTSILEAFWHNFLGPSAKWYKATIIIFLLINPFIVAIDPFLAGWVLILEFIFTLAMALKCYPLQPGGLLAIEAIILGLASTKTVYHEVSSNFPVLLLLMFMVAGIYFMKDLLLFVFTKILLGVRSKILLSLLFSILSALLSAFLDALTVTAVLISVSVGFYGVYHRAASGLRDVHSDHDSGSDENIIELHRSDLDQFRAFLRSLVMHGAIGTALGGVCTLVGEPQNLLIAEKVGWSFIQFFIEMSPVTLPCLAAGLLTCIILEKIKIAGYGATLPNNVREILVAFAHEDAKKRTRIHNVKLFIQAVAALILVLGLAFHLAEVGLIGLMIIVLLTAFTGITEEHQIGKAFEEAMPFTALLVVFFAVVAVIHEQHLFSPITHWVLSLNENIQGPALFLANGVLSMISDNVFVATVYITEVQEALKLGHISREHFETLAIAINTGTNLPSIATPNGQAAFLFLLTSALAPLIRLSYGRMVIMALPYTLVLTSVALMCVTYLI